MAVDPTANGVFHATHLIALDPGDHEIIEGIPETVVSISDQTDPGYQRLNLTLSTDIPGSAEALALRPFGTGQEVYVQNDLRQWCQFNVREVSGNDLALKPTTQRV